MRKVSPGDNSPPLGLSRKGQPSREGCYIFTYVGSCGLQWPDSDRKMNGSPWEEGPGRQCGLIKRTVIIIIFKALFLWERKDRDFIGLKCIKLSCFQPPRGASAQPTGSVMCSSSWERGSCLRPFSAPTFFWGAIFFLRPYPFLFRLGGGPDDYSLYSTNSDCRLKSVFPGTWGTGQGLMR